MTGRPRDSNGAAYLGIDVGSTAAKAIVFDGSGTSLATATQGYEVARPGPDRAEQDAGEWVAAVDVCVARLAAATDLGTVAGIGVTGQVDTHVLVDDAFEPLGPALTWQDVRSAGEADALNARLGEPGRLRGWGDARPIGPSNPVPRALWLARHTPAAWAASRWLLLPKDLVNARLTGVAATDPLAAFPVVDGRADIAGGGARYVPGVAHAPGLAERLPPLRSPDELSGVTIHERHGVPAGTPVATSTMDAYCNVLGSGLHEPGDTMIVLGTSAIVAAVGDGPTSGPGVVGFAPFRGRHVHAGPTQSGGEALRWWARASGHTLEEVLDAAATAPVSGGLIFAPHLLGERAPLWDSAVRAWFTGIDASTDFPRLSRAVLEGVAFAVRELLGAVQVASGVPTRRIVLSGGGARSLLWCQILADVVGLAVDRSRERDTAVVGAATLAAAAVTGSDPWQQAATLAQCDAHLEPAPAATARYDELFALYRATYPALAPLHRGLRDLRARDEPVP